jgi:dihydrofolate reductase
MQKNYMRKIILFMTYSLDGFVGGPKGELDWEVRDDEVGKFMVPDMLRTVDSMLLGRVLFQGFSQAWPAMAANPSSPKDLVDFARWIEDTPKMVFSQSLDKVGWKNATLVSVASDEDVARQVQNLKQQPGGDMVVFGGARFAQTLTRLGLIDEYRLKVQPIALGAGLPLFDRNNRTKLKLAKTKEFSSGVVVLYYQPINEK